jgi:hypothetical protein
MVDLPPQQPGQANPWGSRCGRQSAPSRAPSWPGTVRVEGLVSVWRSASEVFRSTRSRLEHTLPGRIWTQLGELGFIDSSLQFAALFTLSFIPFLMLLSVVLGRDLPRALAARSEFNATASHDVTALFAPGRSALTSLSIIGIVLVIFGAESVSRILQTWYAKTFRAEIHGWKALARRAEWLAGVFGIGATIAGQANRSTRPGASAGPGRQHKLRSRCGRGGRRLQ